MRKQSGRLRGLYEMCGAGWEEGDYGLLISAVLILIVLIQGFFWLMQDACLRVGEMRT